jgi:hypothetical protein
MSQETWEIDDLDRPDRPTGSGFLDVGDKIVVTVDEQDLVTVEVPGKVPPLCGTQRVQGWFHWIEGYVFIPANSPTNGTLYTFHAFPRVNGHMHWLEGFVERIVLTDGTLGDVRDTETWTAMKQPPQDPGDE